MLLSFLRIPLRTLARNTSNPSDRTRVPQSMSIHPSQASARNQTESQEQHAIICVSRHSFSPASKLAQPWRESDGTESQSIGIRSHG